MSSYKSIWVGDLKCRGNGAAIISWVNGWLLFKHEDGGQDACVGVIFYH